MPSNKKRFDNIVRDIKNVKIQGARNIALSALKAYSIIPSEKSKKILLASRPTEPMMANVLHMTNEKNNREILSHFDSAQKKINEIVTKLIKNGDIIFTHCHSTAVSKALIHAKKHGKKFQVYNTETRPLYQGRKTAKELKGAGIKVTMFVDSAMATALERDPKKKVFIGADALIEKGIINKIGSKAVAEIASLNKIPFYVVSDSWKFTRSSVPMEQRSLNEVWNHAPRAIKIKNPAFEFVSKKYLKAIITEYGITKYDDFLKKVNKK